MQNKLFFVSRIRRLVYVCFHAANWDFLLNPMMLQWSIILTHTYRHCKYAVQCIPSFLPSISYLKWKSEVERVESFSAELVKGVLPVQAAACVQYDTVVVVGNGIEKRDV